MDEARAAGRAAASHGHTILADEQTAGRGRFGRRWVAPPGSNLTFTILVRPTIETLESLSIIAALAVAEGVRAVTGIDPVFKWPNDVQVDGRKLAGILIEAEFSGDQPSFALVGIGLNVNQDSRAEPEIADIAVSLRDLLGHEVEREAMLAAVLDSFERWYVRAPDPAICDAWSSKLVTLGQTISVSFAGQVESGLAESVTPIGALRLRRADGSVVVLPAGEVTTRLPGDSRVG
jgi:BirA family biotin operon repressor/biotin-[acetyl-CoA-carboxylase] ligase